MKFDSVHNTTTHNSKTTPVINFLCDRLKTTGIVMIPQRRRDCLLSDPESSSEDDSSMPRAMVKMD
jgi:hypothetical protein